MRSRFQWLYILSGLAIGLGIGLLISWVFSPIVFTETLPANLRSDYRDQYRVMIASAYSANPDFLRARARLMTISEIDPLQLVEEQLQRMKTNNAPADQIKYLSELGEALKSHATAEPAPSKTSTATSVSAAIPSAASTLLATRIPATSTPVSPVPSSTTADTDTPTPIIESTFTDVPTAPTPIASVTPSPTSGLPFELTKQTPVCDPDLPGLLQIRLVDSYGKPAFGIELIMTWSEGEDHFFTGLKPEIGPGYADFNMSDEIVYMLSLSAGNTRISDLSTSACADSQGNKYSGGIQLELVQP